MSPERTFNCKHCGDPLLPGFTDYCSEGCEQRDQMQAKFDAWLEEQEKEMEDKHEKV